MTSLATRRRRYAEDPAYREKRLTKSREIYRSSEAYRKKVIARAKAYREKMLSTPEGAVGFKKKQHEKYLRWKEKVKWDPVRLAHIRERNRRFMAAKLAKDKELAANDPAFAKVYRAKRREQAKAKNKHEQERLAADAVLRERRKAMKRAQYARRTADPLRHAGKKASSLAGYYRTRDVLANDDTRRLAALEKRRAYSRQ